MSRITVYNAMKGQTKDMEVENLPLTVERDANGKAVIRTVDAAPFAYDAANDKKKVDDTNTQNKIGELINAISNTSYTGKVDSEMPVVVKAKAITNLKYIYPLQEANSWTAYDLSTNAFNGQKINIKTVNTDGFNCPRRFANLRSNADAYIRAPKNCSVRNLSAFTWFGLVNVSAQTAAKKLYAESCSNDASAGRFQIVLNSNLTLTVFVRSGLSSQAALTYTSTGAIPLGWNLLCVTVDVATSMITFHWNGNTARAGTITNSLSPDTKIADTAPAGIIYIGAGNASPSYVGDMAYIGLYERVLTQTEMQDLSIAAGTLSLDRV